MMARSRVAVVLLLVTACDLAPDVEPAPAPAPVPEPTDAFRHLPGLRAAAISGAATSAAASAMDAVGTVEAGCRSGSTDVVSIVADVMAAPGEETVLASIARGVVVLDRSGRVLARARPFSCGGSADEMMSLAAGDLGIGHPVIVAVATLGGRAETATYVGVLDVDDHRLHRAFSGVIERRDGDVVQRGSLRLVDGALRLEPPGEAATRWVYAPGARAFVRR